MMKKIFISALFAAFFAATAFAAKNDKDVVYIFGVSINYTDSVAYFTEVIPVKGVKLENGILPDRQHYAYELKDYMSVNEGLPNRTSVIFFAKKRSKLEKVEQTVKSRLLRGEKKMVRYLGDKFTFTRPR